MRYYNQEKSGIYLIFSKGQYYMKLPDTENFIDKNAFGQPIVPGSFLLSIFNINLGFLDLDVTLNFFERNVTDEKYMKYSSLENELDNYRDAINSNIRDIRHFDYYKNGIGSSFFPELLATQLFDILNAFKNDDIEDCFIEANESISYLRQIQKFSSMIFEDYPISKECLFTIKQYTPKMYFDEDDDGKLIQKYYIRSVFELFALDAYIYLNLSSKPKMCLCKLCGRYFIKRKKSTEAYCQYPNRCLGYTPCLKYHKENPSYIDPISKIVNNAVKAQNKYYNTYIEMSNNQHDIWNKWTHELKKREKKARITKDIAPLEQFIENTRFKKTGFSDIDYSNL